MPKKKKPSIKKTNPFAKKIKQKTQAVINETLLREFQELLIGYKALTNLFIKKGVLTQRELDDIIKEVESEINEDS